MVAMAEYLKVVDEELEQVEALKAQVQLVRSLSFSQIPLPPLCLSVCLSVSLRSVQFIALL